MIGQIDFKHKKVVVIGGGQQAFLKGSRFEGEGARVCYIAEEYTDFFRTRAKIENKSMVCIQKRYDKQDIADAFLVYACTDSRTLNHQIVLDANADSRLSASVHKEEEASFHALKEEAFGDIRAAVSTNGAYPAFGQVIMDDLRVRYEESYRQRLEILLWLREKILALPLEKEEKRKQLQDFAYAPYEELLLYKQAWERKQPSE